MPPHSAKGKGGASLRVNEKRHPLPVVADLAGHACITTTKNYLHQNEDQAIKAIEDLDL